MSSNAYAIASKAQFFPTKIYNQLIPKIYVTEDTKTLQKVLIDTTTTDEDISTRIPGILPDDIPVTIVSGERFNFDEDQYEEHGQLRRYLKIIGLEFDQMKALIDVVPDFFDVDKAPPEFLVLMGKLIGLDVNQELSISQQRNEIKNWVSLLKEKGTIPGIIDLIKTITGVNEVTVVEGWTRVFFFNDENSLFGTAVMPLEDVHYFLGVSDDTMWSLNTIIIYITLDEGVGLSEVVQEKLERLLPEFIPAGRRTFIIVDTDVVLSDDLASLDVDDSSSTDMEIAEVFTFTSENSLFTNEKSLMMTFP